MDMLRFHHVQRAVAPLYQRAFDAEYVSDVKTDVSTENFYWASRIIDTLTDHDYNTCIQDVERYQEAVVTKGRETVLEYDAKMTEKDSFGLAEEANSKLCDMAREKTTELLNKLVLESSKHMKNGYNRADN